MGNNGIARSNKIGQNKILYVYGILSHLKRTAPESFVYIPSYSKDFWLLLLPEYYCAHFPAP